MAISFPEYNRTTRVRMPRVLKSRAGVVSLEFGVIAAALLLLVFSCMDVGFYLFTEHALRAFVAETARAAQFNPDFGGTFSGKSALNATPVAGALPPLNLAQLSLCVSQSAAFSTYNGCGASVNLANNNIVVKATYTYSALSPLWTALNGPMTESTMITY